MATRKCFDAIVSGAGVAGSATAFELAKRGLSVALLEQFDFGHRRGSSHGDSRIIRRTYAEPALTASMTESYALWEAAQQAWGHSVFTRTGGLDFGLPAALEPVFASARAHGVPHERLTAAQARARFPAFELPDSYAALFQADAGILNASKAVRMFQELARAQGALLRDCAAVTEVQPRAGPGTDVVLQLSDGSEMRAKQVVLAGGAWMPRLLGTLGLDVSASLRAVRVAYSYWNIKPGASAAHLSSAVCPVAIHYGAAGGFGGGAAASASHDSEAAECYLLPEHELKGMVKVSLHLPEHLWGPPLTGDMGAASCTPPAHIVQRHVAPFVRDHLPGVDASAPALVEACLYTMTDDQNFVLDEAAPGVFASSCCSGHGFKFAPLVGAAMADVVMEGRTRRFGSLDLGLQRLLRR